MRTGPTGFGGISLLDPYWTSDARMATDVVPVYSLDGVGLNRCPTLIKIDVEGMELAVLKGARATIARCKSVLFFENNCVRGSRELLAFANEHILHEVSFGKVGIRGGEQINCQ